LGMLQGAEEEERTKREEGRAFCIGKSLCSVSTGLLVLLAAAVPCRSSHNNDGSSLQSWAAVLLAVAAVPAS
jgi:hypothetical protein